MSRAKIVKEEMVERDLSFFAVFIETENASQLFLSEGKDRLGTLAVAIPQKQKLVGPPLSSVLLGDRNMMVARVLAELLAQKTNKMGLVSVFNLLVNRKLLLFFGNCWKRLLKKKKTKAESREKTVMPKPSC